MTTPVLPFNTNLVLLGVCIICIVATFFMFLYASNIRKVSPIAAVEAKCKKERYPMIKVIDPTGKTEYYVGKVDRKTQPTFKGDNLGIQIRPELLNKVETETTPSGVNVYPYHSNFHFVVGHLGGRALTSVVDHIRKTHPELDFIYDDLELTELFFTPANQLTDDCKMVLDVYEQTTSSTMELRDANGNTVLNDDGSVRTVENDEYIKVNRLKEIIETTRNEVDGLPMKPGFVSVHRGLSLVPVATTAQEMARFEHAIVSDLMDKLGEDYKKFVLYAVMISVPLAILVLGIIAMKVMK